MSQEQVERRRIQSPDRGFFDLFDWPFRPTETWQRLMGEDQFKVEEFTADGELVVRAELPGIDPDRDVDISIDNGTLCIRAERRQESTTTERHFRRSEIRYGAFSRMLALPPNAKEEDIHASYKDGILEVRAPLASPDERRSKITVSRS
jgi:HSP20 family protein